MSSFGPTQKGLATAGNNPGQAGSSGEGRAAERPCSCNPEKVTVGAIPLRSHTETKKERRPKNSVELALCSMGMFHARQNSLMT